MSASAKAISPSDYHELTYGITRLLADAPSIEQSIPVILKLLADKLAWDLANWWTVNDYKLLLQFSETWSMPGVDFPNFIKVSSAREFSVGEGLPGTAWASRTAVWFPDVARELNFPRASVARMDGLHTGVGFPLRGSPSVVGVIELFSRDVRRPESTLIEFLGGLGAQIGVFVERARALEQLRHLDAQFQHLASTTAEAIFTIDESSKILFANSAIERILGYTPEELVGQNLTVLIPARLREQHRAGLKRYMQTGQRKLAWEAVRLPGLHKNGWEVELEISFAEFQKASQRVFTGFVREASAAEGLKSARSGEVGGARR